MQWQKYPKIKKVVTNLLVKWSWPTSQVHNAVWWQRRIQSVRKIHRNAADQNWTDWQTHRSKCFIYLNVFSRVSFCKLKCFFYLFPTFSGPYALTFTGGQFIIAGHFSGLSIWTFLAVEHLSCLAFIVTYRAVIANSRRVCVVCISVVIAGTALNCDEEKMTKLIIHKLKKHD